MKIFFTPTNENVMRKTLYPTTIFIHGNLAFCVNDPYKLSINIIVSLAER